MPAEASKERSDEVQELDREMVRLLGLLDQLGHHQAAAHVDLALSLIRRDRSPAKD